MSVPTLKALTTIHIENAWRNGNLADYNLTELEDIQSLEEFYNLSPFCYLDEDDLIWVIQNRIYNQSESLHKLFEKDSDCLVYGQIQSGKTKLIIMSSWITQYIKKQHTILILRNITYDVMQFNQRIHEFNKNIIIDKRFFINTYYTKNIDKFPNTPSIITALYNYRQLNKLTRMIYGYNKLCNGIFNKHNEYGILSEHITLDNNYVFINNRKYNCEIEGKQLYFENDFFRSSNGTYNVYELQLDPKQNYNLIIDEVDITKISCNDSGKSEFSLEKLKDGAKTIFGYTATSLSSIINDRFTRVVRLPIPKNYIGVDKINFQIIQNDKNNKTNPIHNIYNTFIKKDHGILLHNTTGYIRKHTDIAIKLKDIYGENLLVMTHNGSGIKVYCQTKSYSYNKKYYKINHIDNHTIHIFKRTPFSKVLQIIKDENKYKHIVIIARNIASRGMSYVSEDYKWHITDQIYCNTLVTSDSLLQSLRCCGIWEINPNVTLWTTDHIKESVLNYHSYTDKCMEEIEKNPNIHPFNVIQQVPTDKRIFRLYKKGKLNNIYWIKIDDKYYIRPEQNNNVVNYEGFNWVEAYQ